ncbi:MAG TPA: lipid-A-disaccharide synthase, partial [Pyrinomonadaceae bacterium]|nr:lipid-A-disaccharide synthase [Pyrinomonadaceae bacterium]
MATNIYRVMIVAGEASGDLHSAKLVNALRDSAPNSSFEFFGAAGERMLDAGVDPVVKSDGFSIVGLPEIGRALPMFLRAFNSLKQAAAERQPDVVVLVDFPDFNLKLAKALSKRGFKIVYYISPQLWAWRQYRIKAIKKYVDLLISILPFEKDWYAARGVTHIEYVGSPLAREVNPERDKETFCREHGLDTGRPIVALLPGSRHKEIVRILPVLLETATRTESTDPTIQFVIAAGSEKNVADIKKAVEDAERLPASLTTVVGETFDALKASDAAAVTSGTATLETAIIGT